jgi:hypothetical protein
MNDSWAMQAFACPTIAELQNSIGGFLNSQRVAASDIVQLSHGVALAANGAVFSALVVIRVRQ